MKYSLCNWCLRACLTSLIVVSLAAGQSNIKEPRLSDQRVVLHTTRGDIALAFYPEVAPKHTDQLLRLFSTGLYDGASFFRYIPNFIVQVSPFVNRPQPASAAQMAAVARIPQEPGGLLHRRGVLSMARPDNDPNGGDVSFSILLGPAPHLDGKYTIFGEVTAGMDVVEAIGRAVQENESRWVAPLLIDQVRVVTAEELSRALLKPLQHVEAMNTASPDSLKEKRILQWTLGALLALLALQVVFSRWLSNRLQRSLLLLEILSGYFVLLVVTLPDGFTRPLLALCLFLSLVGLFKLMSRFDSAE